MANGQYQSQFQSPKKSLDSNLNKTNLNNDMSAKYKVARRRETIADLLVHRFNNAEYKGFYYKVASILPEHKIWEFVETACTNGSNPPRYFSYLCKKAGV